MQITRENGGQAQGNCCFLAILDWLCSFYMHLLKQQREMALSDSSSSVCSAVQELITLTEFHVTPLLEG